MNYLVLGVNGMAGHMIAGYLQEQGQSVLGLGRRESPICPTYIGNVCDQAVLPRVLEADDFDYVINCIGKLNQAVDQNLPEGIYLNSILPHLLAGLLRGKRAKLIHLSTDCVFQGTKGAYVERDRPDAETYYGRSKALGEVIDDKNLTIRTSIVGPELKSDGVGLFHWFMSQQGDVPGFSHVIWSGVTTLQLAKAVLRDAGEPRTGICHLVNNKTISKYELLALFGRYCRGGQTPRICQTSVPRCDKSLRTTDASISLPDYGDMVAEMAEWIRGHPGLYRQYALE